LFKFKQNQEDCCGEHHPDATETGDEYNYGITSRGCIRMNKLEQGNIPVKSSVVPNSLFSQNQQRDEDTKTSPGAADAW